MTRREDWLYPLASGQKLPGIHPGMVAELVHTLEFYGFQPGPKAEDAGARALAAVFAWMERHEAEEREHGRRHAESSREMQTLIQLAEARRRAAAHGGAT